MKSNVIAVLLFILGIQSAAAQLDLNKLKIQYKTVSTDSSIINDALAPALSVVRQQYRLERGGDFYGKSKRPYYGETYSLGIKISGGTILQRGVIAPWENDNDFQRVNKDGKYKAVWYRSLQHSLQDSIWQPVELELGTQYVSPYNSDSTLYVHTDALSDFGLPIDETPGKKQGYLVWAYAAPSVQDSTMHIRLRQSSFQVDASPDSTVMAVTPADADKVIGGLLVVPVIERAGYIKLLMAGVASRNPDGHWLLHLLAKDEETLTPAGTSAKGKGKHKKDKEPKESNGVNATDDSEPTPIK